MDRKKPDVDALLEILNEHGVEYVVTGLHRWVADEATPENLAARASWTPNPREPATFDSLLDSDFGSIDIVPTIGGTYEQLAPRAVSVQRGGYSVLVEAVSDLLATLTVPRREKDADRVRQLRRIQRHQECGSGAFRCAQASAGAEAVGECRVHTRRVPRHLEQS